MGTFKSVKTFYTSPRLVDAIANRIESEFISEGYFVKKESLLSGGYDISITKGNIFKAVLGMKSALKVLIRAQDRSIYVEAGVGIFGQQFLPTAITFLVAWPVMITQIWGMVKQSKLDDRVLEIAEEVVNTSSNASDYSGGESLKTKFCTECGVKMSEEAKFCSECGFKL